MSGNALSEHCSSGENEFFEGVCVGYIVSVLDVQTTLVSWSDMKPNICLPRGVSPLQIKQVVVKYMDNHPQDLHLLAASLALNALKEAFPCK